MDLSLLDDPTGLVALATPDSTDIVGIWDVSIAKWRYSTVAQVVAAYGPALKNAGGATGWNAGTNTPTLTDVGSGVAGTFYRVTTAGSTTLNGVSSWAAGDLVVDTLGTGWAKWAVGGGGSFSGNLDDVPDGTSYVRVTPTQVTKLADLTVLSSGALTAIGNLPADTTTAMSGKVGTTRAIVTAAGSGLTGGDDLTADVTLAVNFTASGTGDPGTGTQVPRNDHRHDSYYYTETEVDSALNGKAASSHVHAAGTSTVAGFLPSGGTTGQVMTRHADLSSVWADAAGGVATSRTIGTAAGSGLTGGGDLSADRSLAINIPTQSVAEAGSNNDTVLTPLRGKQQFDYQVGLLTLDAIDDSAAGAGRKALTTAQVDKLDGFGATPINPQVYRPIGSDGQITLAALPALVSFQSGSTGNLTSLDLTGVTSLAVNGVLETAVGSAGSYIAIMGSTDLGVTWKTFHATTPATITAGGVDPGKAASQGTALDGTLNAALTGTVTVPPSFQTRIHVSYFTAAGNGVATPRTRGLEWVAATGDAVASGVPALMLDADVTTGTSTTPKTPSAAQMKLASETFGGGGTLITDTEARRGGLTATRSYSPFLAEVATLAIVRRPAFSLSAYVWGRGRTVKWLDSGFGVNNLTPDSTRAGGGTDNIARINNILASLTGPTDLKMRDGQYFRISKPIFLHLTDYLRFINDGSSGSAGFVNDTVVTGNDVAPGCVYFAGSCTYGAWDSNNNIHRLALGVDGTGDLHTNDTEIRVSLADYNYAAARIGEKIFIKSPYIYIDGAGNYHKPMRIWVAQIAGVRSLSGTYYIGFTECLPFEFKNVNNGSYYYMDSSGSLVNGVAFHFASQMPAASFILGSAPASLVKDFQAFGTEWHDVYLRSMTSALTQTGMGSNQKFFRCEMHASKVLFYGNLLLNTHYYDCRGSFGGRLSEFSMCSALNNIDTCRFWWNGDTAYGGETTSRLHAWQEASHANRMIDTVVDFRGYARDGGLNPISCIKNAGDNNINKHLVFMGLQSPNTQEIYTQEVGWLPTGSVYEDIVVEHTGTTGTNGSTHITILGTGVRVSGFTFKTPNGFNAGTAKSTIANGSSWCALEDISIPTAPGATIGTGSRNRVSRVNGTTTNNGTNSDISTAAVTPNPAFWRHATQIPL